MSKTSEETNGARATVGKLSSDLLKKAEPVNPVEQMREQLTDYERELLNCIMENRKKIDGNFYVVVITKKERLMPNVLRNYFFARISCPTPDYDQALYRYNATTQDVEFLWVVPSKDTCIIFKESYLSVVPGEWELLKYVLEFYDGTLMKKCKELNGEKVDSPLLEKGKR